jgi:acyl-CoA synthetase (AMP-forming)/AMP-acid ligase II
VLDACTEPPRRIPLLQLLCAADALAQQMREALAASGDGDAGFSLLRGPPAVPLAETGSPQVEAAASPVQPEDDEADPLFVGVLVSEGPMLVIAPIAALLCGFAFVLLDPCTPRERLRFQLKNTRARLLIMPPSDGDGDGQVVGEKDGAETDGSWSFTDRVHGREPGLHNTGEGIHGSEPGIHSAGAAVHGAEPSWKCIPLAVSADQLLDEAEQLICGRGQPPPTGGGGEGGWDSRGCGDQSETGSRSEPATSAHTISSAPYDTAADGSGATKPSTAAAAGTCTSVAALTARLRARLIAASHPSRLAYVCYTSGSTGRPKGCAVERRALGAYAVANGRAHSVREGDRVLLASGVGFDPVRGNQLLGMVGSGFVSGWLVWGSSDSEKRVSGSIRCVRDWGRDGLGLAGFGF